jgi:hypothetical protein
LSSLRPTPSLLQLKPRHRQNLLTADRGLYYLSQDLRNIFSGRPGPKTSNVTCQKRGGLSRTCYGVCVASRRPCSRGPSISRGKHVIGSPPRSPPAEEYDHDGFVGEFVAPSQPLSIWDIGPGSPSATTPSQCVSTNELERWAGTSQSSVPVTRIVGMRSNSERPIETKPQDVCILRIMCNSLRYL